MIMIEINENKMHSLAENIEKALRYAGKAMQIIDDAKHSNSGYNERNDDYSYDDDYDDMSRYGSRMGNRYGERNRNYRGGRY